MICNIRNGWFSVCREKGDMMGLIGLVEIHMCLYAQYEQ
jgi:hypothetical protein